MTTSRRDPADAASVRSYASREWGLVGDSKQAWWTRRYRELGPTATVAAGWALLSHLRSLHQEAPGDRDRDLADHVRLNGWLDRTNVRTSR